MALLGMPEDDGHVATGTCAVGAFERHRAGVRERLLAADIPRSGPGSVTWKIHAEIIVVAGWGRAILLQLAHPAIAAGLRDHSAFRGSLLSGFRRLRATVAAMLSLTFGDTEDMIAAAAGINAIHDRVQGRIRAGGRAVSGGDAGLAGGPGVGGARGSEIARYSAHDPELQRWVHVTLIESIPLAYELLVAPLTAGERDRYCLEAAVMEPLLGMPAGWLPRDSAQLDACMREMLSGEAIAVTDTSMTLARAVLFPPRWHTAWPVFRAMQLLTVGTLPPAIRQAYGFAWRAREARAFARWTALLRTSLSVVPRFARQWPVARRRTASVLLPTLARAEAEPSSAMASGRNPS